jgi:hypothetical protein
VRDCIELGLTNIPRGGGTGYTGGAIPLSPLSAVINTEKLEFLGHVERIELSGKLRAVETILTGAGVVSKRASDVSGPPARIRGSGGTSQRCYVPPFGGFAARFRAIYSPKAGGISRQTSAPNQSETLLIGVPSGNRRVWFRSCVQISQ